MINVGLGSFHVLCYLFSLVKLLVAASFFFSLLVFVPGWDASYAPFFIYFDLLKKITALLLILKKGKAWGASLDLPNRVLMTCWGSPMEEDCLLINPCEGQHVLTPVTCWSARIFPENAPQTYWIGCQWYILGISYGGRCEIQQMLTLVACCSAWGSLE